jgi:hypothetical protein
MRARRRALGRAACPHLTPPLPLLLLPHRAPRQGGLGGLAYGFATGYWSAIRGSARLVGRLGAGAVSAVAWFTLRGARRAAAAAAAALRV